MYHSSFSCVHLAAQENFRTCALIHELPALLHSARARASMKLGGGARSLENTKASVVWQSGSPYPRGYNRTYRSTRCGAPSTIGLRVRSSPFRLASFERREDSRLFDPTSSPYGTQLARWISTAIKRGSRRASAFVRLSGRKNAATTSARASMACASLLCRLICMPCCCSSWSPSASVLHTLSSSPAEAEDDERA